MVDRFGYGIIIRTYDKGGQMQQQLETLLDDNRKDYVKGCDNEDMNNEFCQGLQIHDKGKKYIKITKRLGIQRMVWGFIVKEDGPKFKKGDILKASGYNAPALNRARGNILEGGYTIKWTGPLYLK